MKEKKGKKMFEICLTKLPMKKKTTNYVSKYSILYNLLLSTMIFNYLITYYLNNMDSIVDRSAGRSSSM